MRHEASGVGSRFIDGLFVGASRAADDTARLDGDRIYEVGQDMY